MRSFDYKRSSDFRYRDDFTNADGAGLKFWNETQGYVVYDKASEIAANKKSKLEKQIAELIESGKSKKDLMRFELSLQRKQSMDMILRRCFKTKQKDFTVQQLMSSEGRNVSKQLLLETFDSIYSNQNIAILTLAEMQENVLEQLLIQKNLHINKHALLFYTVNKAIKNGIAATLAELKGRCPPATYSRYKKDISEIIAELGDLPGEIPPIVKYFRQQQEKFTIIKANPPPYDL